MDVEPLGGGPLGPLVGEWEGEGGLDTAYSHAAHEVRGTPYLEKVTMKPFGPVDNGDQHLYGLDYRTAMWRGVEENPFHTEVGYWLWDPELGETGFGAVMRCFVIPRAQVILAGGPASVDASEFTMEAELGSLTFGLLSNPFLDRAAHTSRYECTVTVHEDGTWSYDETTVIEHARSEDVVLHTDRNRLHRTGD